jgi:hypothetical protein
MQEEASEFAAFIGIDWADRKHDVCLQVAGTETCEVSVLEHGDRKNKRGSSDNGALRQLPDPRLRGLRPPCRAKTRTPSGP